MPRLAIVAQCFVVSLAFAAPLAAQEARSVTGVYACEGVSADGRYRAMLELVQHGDQVHARWTFAEGLQVLGIGLVRNGVVAISYSGPVAVGLVVYEVENGAISVGDWITPASQGVYREWVLKLPHALRQPQRDEPPSKTTRAPRSGIPI
jgi:hypothetical protein